MYSICMCVTVIMQHSICRNFLYMKYNVFSHQLEDLCHALITPMASVLHICSLVVAILLVVSVVTKSLSIWLQTLKRFV